MLKKTLPFLACFLLLLGVFCALILAGLSFTDDRSVAAHLRQGFERGALPRAEYPTSVFGHHDHQFDMFSECVGLGVNLGNVGDPLLRRLAASPYVGPADPATPAVVGAGSPCHDLDKALEGGGAVANLPYFRFWHGYQFYMRAILSNWNLGTLHWLNALLLFGSLIYLAWAFSLRFGPGAWLATLAPMAIATDLLSVPLVTVHSISLTSSFLFAAIVAHMRSRTTGLTTAIGLTAFCGGAVFNFLSMFFNPPLAPTLMAFAMLAFPSSRDPAARKWAGEIDAVEIALLWFLGFGLTWIAKWLLAMTAFDPMEVLATIRSSAQGEHYKAVLFPDRYPDIGSPFTPTLMALFGSTLLAPTILLSWVAAALIAARPLARGAGGRIAAFFRLQIPLLIPLLWCEVFRLHSVEHAGYVSRNFVVFAILPLLTALLVAARVLHGATDAAALSVAKITRFHDCVRAQTRHSSFSRNGRSSAVTSHSRRRFNAYS